MRIEIGAKREEQGFVEIANAKKIRGSNEQKKDADNR